MKGLLQIIILLGAIQGFIVSVLLFYAPNNRLANRLLAAFIFLLASASFAGCHHRYLAGIAKKNMEENQLYLNPELTLSVVAQHTGLAPKTISAVLNQHLHKKFNEYVNEYRVNLFKEKLLQADAAQLTFAGFSSTATFRRVFKQLTGMSPSAFRKSTTEI